MFFFAFGCIVAIIVMSIPYVYLDYNVNVIDALMLIATIALSIIVLYLSKRLQNNDIIRDITISDLNDLCDMYKSNSELFKKFKTESQSQEELQKEINMAFDKADLLIDRIDKEFKESFPKMLDYKYNMSLKTITEPYWKWVTDGELMEKGFKVSPTYIRNHEIQLSNLVGELKLVIHKLIKIS